MGFPYFGAAARSLPPAPEPTLQTGITGSIPLYTLGGAFSAEHLVPGDQILSRTSGSVILRDIGITLHDGPMVRIAPDTLGRARPEDFLMLPPDQRLQLRRATGASRDGLFAARDLVDGELVKWYQPRGAVRLVRLHFDSPQIVYAGGLELEVL